MLAILPIPHRISRAEIIRIMSDENRATERLILIEHPRGCSRLCDLHYTLNRVHRLHRGRDYRRGIPRCVSLS